MNAEQIHDALTLLPSDLIEEADRMRSRKPKMQQWKRFAAMAACFALVFCAGWYGVQIFSIKYAVAGSTAAAPMMQAAEDAAVEAEMAGIGNGAMDTPAEAAPAEAPAAPAPDRAENTMLEIGIPSVTLRVSGGQEEWQIPAQGYYLFALQEDGTRQDLQLDTNAAIPELETACETLALSWSEKPRQLSAWYYEQTTAASDLACSVDSITLLPGTHTYYLTGHWEDYTIRYALRVTLVPGGEEP